MATALAVIALIVSSFSLYVAIKTFEENNGSKERICDGTPEAIIPLRKQASK